MSEHVKINDIAPRIHYVADGAQTLFPFPFPIFQAADIEAHIGDDVQVGGFTVSGAGLSGGGTVSFAMPPRAGARVTLLRRLALQRTTDFQADGVIRAKTLNDELDYQTAALQQLNDEISRAVRKPPTSSATADLSLPDPVPGRALKWSASGSALVNSAHDPDSIGDATAAAEAAIAARAAAETARDQAQAAVGGVRVSDEDSLAGPLSTKLAAGPGITLTAETIDGRERLVVALEAYKRLDFLEFNLAINTLRDQIDAGWSVLKMIDGWADEFHDLLGIDTTATDAIYLAEVKAFGTQELSDFSYGHPQGTGDRTSLIAITGSGISWGDGSYARLIDGALHGNNWHYSSSVSGTQITLDFGTPRYFQQVRFHPDGIFHVIMKVQGSSDAVSWLDIGSLAAGSLSNSSPQFYDIHAQYQTVPFRYVRMQGVSGEWGNGRHTVEIEFKMASELGSVAARQITSSVVQEAATPADEARLILLHQPIDLVIPNTDLIAEASRDGGATWSTGPLTIEGSFDTTTNILTATIPLAGQPEGTAMRWRIRTLNPKLQRLHGVWMQWR